MVADKGKKVKAVEKNEEENNQIDEELILSIEKLQEIQDDLERINEEASDKVLEVEQKYNEIRKPVYDKRNEIMKSIPDFWLTAIISHPALNQFFTEEDHKIFKFLSSLEVEDFEDVKSGYSITFNFQPNPYFEDTKLTKTFTFPDEGSTEIKSTPIKWKEGMGIPNGVSHGKKGKKRSLENDSFFRWFTDTHQEEMIDDMQNEIAEIIKDDLWPNPLAYFSADPEEEDFADADGGDNDDVSEEEDDEQDDEDDNNDGDDEDGEDEGK